MARKESTARSPPYLQTYAIDWTFPVKVSLSSPSKTSSADSAAAEALNRLCLERSWVLLWMTSVVV